MIDDRDEGMEYELDVEDQDVDFESDEELEAALNERSGPSRVDSLKARGRQALSSAAQRGRERLYHAADSSRGRLADVMETAADRIDERLTYGSNYLRTHDVDVIRDDLSTTIRRYPLLSAGVAIGAGYLLGRVLTDAIPGRGKKRGRNRVGRQLSRALVSSIGAMVAARVKDSLARPRSPEIMDD